MDRGMALAREALAATTRLLVGRDVRVTQEGWEAYVELDPATLRPRRVNVPLLPDGAGPELVLATQGYVDHEAAHLLFTDWDVVAEADARGLRGTHNMIEDTFVERMMGERFPGARANLERLATFACATIVPRLLAEAPDDDARLGVLVVQAARAMAGQGPARRFMDEGGHWRAPRVAGLVDLLGAGVVGRMPRLASSAECLEVAEAWAAAARSARLGGPPPGMAPPRALGAAGDARPGMPQPRGSGGGTADRGAGIPSRDDGGRERPPARAEGDGRVARPASSVASRDRGVGRAGAGGPGRGGTGGDPARPLAGDMPGLPDDPFQLASSRAVSGAAARAIAAAPYRVFSREADRVEAPEVPAAFRDEWLSDLERVTTGMAGAMRRDLERMMAARSRSAQLTGLRSGRLRSASLHRLAVGDDRVFGRRVDAPAKDTAVTLLVDGSASMRGERILVAMASAYALATTLERVAIPCEVLGYTTDERPLRWQDILAEGDRCAFSRYAAIRIAVYKPFAQTLTPANRRRFAVAAMTESDAMGNVDGESLQYAATRLLRRPERRKVMLVLSDGTPAVQRGNRAELEAHLERTVTDLARAGVEVVGIGIMTDAVRRFYPRHLTVDALDGLPRAVMGELRRVLGT